jgi:UDPglucose 6-dehydrogenase
MEAARRALANVEGVEFCNEPYAALEDADTLAIVTEWKAFRSPDFSRIQSTINEPVIFDGRNLYDPAAVTVAGIEYHTIGRPVAEVSQLESAS